MFGYVIGVLIGALAIFVLDPKRGRYRPFGNTKLAQLETRRPPAHDAGLADRVRSEVLRDSGIPRGDVLVDVSDGVVTLRGQVERHDIIDELDARVRRVYGVRDVENRLHVRASTLT